MKQPAVHIMVNRRNGTIYTGVTSDLPGRVGQHKNGDVGFTSRYGCKQLVRYGGDMSDAITREKQIKSGSTASKLDLIEAFNLDWSDLFETIVHA